MIPWFFKKRRSELALIMCPSWGIEQPPVGISYLKGFLEQQGVNVKCYDFSLELSKHFSDKKYWDLNNPEYFIMPKLFETNILPRLKPFIDTWARLILKNGHQVVGFSLFMSNINASLLLAKRLKELDPPLFIVGGGPEVTRIKRVLVDGIRGFAPINRDALISGTFDLMVDGEGEVALIEILSLLKQKNDFRVVKGVLYPSDNSLKSNSSRALLNNLDILAPPDYRDFALNDYTKKSLPIVTSRGCINRCTFCADSPLWKIYRYRSPKKVLEEIQFLISEYGIRHFEITDSTFNGSIERLSEICSLIIRYKLGIYWSAKVALRKEMESELLFKMKDSGCTALAYGVESGSPRVLNDMRKNTNITDIKRIIRDTCKAGIHAHCFIMIGYPSEKEEDFEMTLDFVKENSEFVYCFDQITGCHIEEDSFLGLNSDKYGIVFKDDGWHNECSTPAIRKERLEKFRELVRGLHKHYKCEVQL